MKNFTKMEELQKILKDKKHTITCAESCTGGLIASMITQISGSSAIFHGSIVTYSNEVKQSELHVQKQTMIDHGVVSVEVVKQMCHGVLKKFDANYAIAVSGVAGPTGGTKNKPVGTVAIGIISSFGDENIALYHFDGSRKEIQMQTANKAFEIIFNILNKNT